MPKLAPDREAVWGRVFGSEPGRIAPEALAFCRAPRTGDPKTDVKDIEPGAFISRQGYGTCLVRVDGTLVDELNAYLTRWGTDRFGPRTSFIEDHDSLTVSVSRGDGVVDVSWHPHVQLEQIIGDASSGVLLRGFDAKKMAGKLPAALRGAVDKTWTLDIGCDAKACGATGASPPGGTPTKINSINFGGKQGTVAVVAVPGNAVPRVRALLDAALGPHTTGVHRRDGVRYVVTEDRRGVQIEIYEDK